MKIVCPDCQAAYNVSDDRIPAGGARGKCKCGSILKFRRDVLPEQAVNQSITLDQANDAAETEAVQTVMRIFGNSDLYSKKLEEWRSLYSQSPEVAAKLLEMWNTVYDAATKITEPLFGGELANRKLEEWRSLLAQSPEQAANLLTTWAAEYKAKEEIRRLYGILLPDKLEEWQESYRQSSDEAAILLKMWAAIDEIQKKHKGCVPLDFDKFKEWQILYRQCPEKAAEFFNVWATEEETEEEGKKEADTPEEAEIKAKKITSGLYAECSGLGGDQKFEEWRALYRQSPEQAANFLNMLREAMLNWVWEFTRVEREAEKEINRILEDWCPYHYEKIFEEWRTLESQSPGEAADFLKMLDEYKKELHKEKHKLLYLYYFPSEEPETFEEWRALYRQSPEQAADFHKMLAWERGMISTMTYKSDTDNFEIMKDAMTENLRAFYREAPEAASILEEQLLYASAFAEENNGLISTGVFPLHSFFNTFFPQGIPCSRCGSTANRFSVNEELTSAKYQCSFCNKTTIHRSHQDPKKRRREAITESVRVAVMTRAGQCCEICGSNQNLHIDHVVPFSKGGSNDMKNLQLLCRDCNLRKGGN